MKDAMNRIPIDRITDFQHFELQLLKRPSDLRGLRAILSFRQSRLQENNIGYSAEKTLFRRLIINNGNSRIRFLLFFDVFVPLPVDENDINEKYEKNECQKLVANPFPITILLSFLHSNPLGLNLFEYIPIQCNRCKSDSLLPIVLLTKGCFHTSPYCAFPLALPGPPLPPKYASTNSDLAINSTIPLRSLSKI